jgi:hypothetical protein
MHFSYLPFFLLLSKISKIASLYIYYVSNAWKRMPLKMCREQEHEKKLENRALFLITKKEAML